MQAFTLSIFSLVIFFFISNQSVKKMFSDKGISVKESPLEVAEVSDVVITMLPSPTHVSNTFYYQFLRFRLYMKYV